LSKKLNSKRVDQKEGGGQHSSIGQHSTERIWKKKLRR
jgi:hypothetical protein